MAVGDSKITAQYDFNAYTGSYDHSSDTFKYTFITETFSAIDETTSAIALSNFTQVASSGNYVQGTTLTNVSWNRSGQVSALDFDDFSFAADGSNPTTAKTLVIYNDTSTNDDVYKLVDLTADDGTTAADTTLGFNYSVNASGSTTVTSNS